MTTAVAAGFPITRLFDLAGLPLGAGLLYTYQAGSTTPLPTYLDRASTLPNTNPVVLDSTGSAIIRYTEGVGYRLVLTDPTGATVLATLDDYYAPITSLAGLGQVLYPQTALESAANVIPTNYNHVPGAFKRYGALADGSADDTTPITNAFKTGHKVLGGGPENTYRYNSNIAIPLGVNIRFDGQGCTFKPANTSIVANTNVPSIATTTVASGATQGSVSVVVASATGLVVGQIIQFSATGFPTFFATIKSLASTTVGIDYAFPFDYSAATVNVTVYAAGSFYEDVEWRNVKYDLSLLTGGNAALGMCLRIVNALEVWYENIEITKSASVPGATTMTLLEAYLCKQVGIHKVHSHGNVSAVTPANGSMVIIEVDDCNQAVVTDNIIEGQHFGINITRCAQAIVNNNVLHGRSTYEVINSLSLFSTRGIKVTTCGTTQVIGNSLDDYVTPIKVDVAFRATITGNSARNAEFKSGTNNTDAAFELSSTSQANQFGFVITGNVIENSGGLGILFSNGAAATVNGKVICTSNYIRGCQAQAIQISNADCDISDNMIENWDLAATGNPGVMYGDGATANNNQFFHTDNTKVCLQTNFVATYTYCFVGNKSPTGNPLFTGTKVLTAGGSTSIVSGTTSIVVTHGLARTPQAYEVFVVAGNQPTTAPGLISVGSFTSTQFTVTCKVDPGAGGLLILWRAELIQPWTA